MTSSVPTTYRHVQHSPLYLLSYAVATAMLAGAWFARGTPAVPIILSASGALVLLLAVSFHYLSVADAGDRLVVAFGPLPLFRTAIPYDDIRAVEMGRTLFLDGWGIHLSVRGGWVWNIWGRDCVVIHRRRGVIRICTDDAENLAAFLEAKMVLAALQKQ